MINLGIKSSLTWFERPSGPPRLPGFGLEHYYPTGEEEKLWVPEGLRARRKELRPIVVLFIGRRGAGKSLALTTTAWIQHCRYKAMKFPSKVAANYNVTFATYRDPYIIDRLTSFPDWARRLYVCVDEIGSAFPGMRSMASGAILFTQVLGQIRKRAMEVGATTRFAQILGIQHLLEIDLFVKCEARMVADGRQVIHMYVWDIWGQWTGNDYRKLWPPTANPPDWELFFGNTQLVWPMYRTEEVIAPSFSAARDDIIARQWDIGEDDIPIIPKKGQRTTTGLRNAENIKPAESLEEAIAMVSGPFNILSQLGVAKRFNPDIKTKKDFAEWLRANGYKIEQSDHFTVARREE